MKRKDGTISLAAALIVPVLLVFLAELFTFAAKARQDWELVRTAAAGVEAELAGYGRDLQQMFGLFAGPMDGSKAKAATLGMSYGSGLVRVTGDSQLKDSLQSEILRYMKLRAPLQVLSEVLMRHTDTASGGQVPLDSLESNIRSLTNTYDVSAPYDRLINDIDLPDSAQRSELETLIDKEIASLYEGIVTDLMPADLYQPGEGGDADLFNPEHLTNLGAAVDRLFSITDYGVFDRLYLSEYALSHFHHQTPILYKGIRRIELTTPDGRPLAQFPENRRLEVEQILMGGTPLQAKNRTANAIRAIRTVILLANNFTDTSRHGSYRTRAAIVSGVITVVSFGTVVISPESLTYLFMLYDAVSEAKGDVARLQKGFAVRLWPRTSLELYYPDYLRMLLLVQPEKRLTDRMYERIAAVCPGPHYTGVQVTYASDQHEIALNGSYRGLD